MNQQNANTNSMNASTRRDQLSHDIQQDAISNSNASYKQLLDTAIKLADTGDYSMLDELTKAAKSRGK